MRWIHGIRSAARKAIPALISAAVSLTLVSAGAASITPAAQQVVDRYVEVTGGRSALAGDRRLHEIGTVTGFGFSGTAESWRVRPDRERSVMHLGPLTATEGVCGDRAWRQLSGQAVAWLDGTELEDALTSMWFDAERWCESDQGGGQIELAPRRAPHRAGGASLRITPPHGTPRLLEFNAAGFLDVAHAKIDQLAIEQISRDYRPAAGRVRAGRQTQHRPDAPSNDLDVQVLTTDVPAALDDTLFLPGVAETDIAPLFPPGVKSVEVPLTFRAGVPTLRVSVGAHPPASFLLDTGATLSCVDSAYALRLGIVGAGTLQIQGAGAQASVHIARIDSMRIEGAAGAALTMRDMRFVLLDLTSSLHATMEDGLAGILGGDILSRAAFTVDYDRHALTFEDAATFVADAAADTLHLTLASGVPLVMATLDSLDTGLFRLDTGSANGVDLHPAFVASHHIAARVHHAVATEMQGLGGAVKARYFRARSLQLGRQVARVPIASISTASTGAFTSENIAGNIGNLILNRFRCTFDYTHRLLYLVPSATFDQELRLGTMRLRPEQAGWRVWAEPSGPRRLHSGDLITDIEGDAISVLSSVQLSSRLRAATPGDPLRLGVRRGEAAKRIVLSYPASP